MKKLHFLLIVAISIFTFSCTTSTENEPSFQEILPSWKDSQSKLNIIEFVEESTNPNSSDFIPVSERIATFDNDGTLWAEQPIYFQLYYTIDKIKELAQEHPEWKNKQPYKAVIEDDFETLSSIDVHELFELIATSHANTTIDEFEHSVKEWSKTAKHPTKKVAFQNLVYQPMLELISYLQANEFKVYIVSGGGIDFMRAFLTDVYNIPSEQIIGSQLKTEFIEDGETFKIVRTSEIESLNDKEVKPLNIQKFIGKKPTVAVGNSDGDLAMMQWSNTCKHKSLQIYIHHTDPIREWAYDRDSKIGKLDKGLDVASLKNWTVVDMKEEWLTIFPLPKN